MKEINRERERGGGCKRSGGMKVINGGLSMLLHESEEGKGVTNYIEKPSGCHCLLGIYSIEREKEASM